MSHSDRQETYTEKMQFVYKQTKQMMDEVRPFVRCHCMKKLWPHQAYKCLYCGEWYCKECAEVHFGKTVDEYRLEHPVEAENEAAVKKYLEEAQAERHPHVTGFELRSITEIIEG